MIRSERAHLHVTALSHAGKVGKNNEDRYAVSSYTLGEDDPTPSLFAVVSDGIGGHLAGEVAAELAVNYISQEVAESNAQQPKKILEKAIRIASDAIASHAAVHLDRQGMGGTCACAWVIGERLYIAHVGDSRIYLLRGGAIHQLTTDHTWVQEAIDKGILQPEQARDHPNVHVIRRHLGSAKPPEVDFRLWLRGDENDTQAKYNQGMTLQPGDLLLLCSDGLTDMVWNDEILKTVQSSPNLKAAGQALIDLANQRGGHDNITVILVSVPSAEQPKTRRRKRGFLDRFLGDA